jgi:phosphatidylserine/phosphatidylglycerophosphate/cardiolipin synthase-like enzyme
MRTPSVYRLFATIVVLAPLALVLSGPFPGSPSAAASGRLVTRPPMELVESIPIGTVLDNPGIRNTQEVWVEMIGDARRTLDIEQFYISNARGEALDTVITAIVQAAERGVSVRLIVDSKMYKTYPETADSLGNRPGISMRVIDFAKIAGGIQHAKFFIVDGRTVFLGSQNFDWRALTHIHELGFRIEDAATAAALGKVFEIDWALADKGNTLASEKLVQAEQLHVPFRIPLVPGDTVHLTPTWSPRGLIPDSSLWDEPQIINLIDGARKNLRLQFLSFSATGRDRTPYPVFDDAIRRAAQRGVKVMMIVADWGKSTPSESNLKALSSVPNVQVRYSVIPEWSGGYVSYARVEHCKYVVADEDRFWLGTSNCEKSYFHASRNIGIVCANGTLTRTLEQIFSKSWNGPYVEPISPEGIYAPRKHGGE